MVAYRRGAGLIALGCALVALAACSSSDPGPLVETNDSASESVASEAPEPAPAPAPEPAPAPIRNETAAVAVPPPEPPPAPDAQMQDDADATGMTARVTREAAAENADASAESAPAQ